MEARAIVLEDSLWKFEKGKGMRSEPKRLSPSGGWNLIGIYPEYTAYQKGQICAISSLVEVEDEHLPLHQEWLVSFSVMGRARASNAQIKMALKDFDALDFEEDNHERGIARKFWKAADPKYRIPCPCKNEKVIVEGEYQYSVKHPAPEERE